MPRRHLWDNHVITSWTWPTLAGQMLHPQGRVPESRSILQHSNAPFVRNVSPVHTTCAHTSVPIRMSAHLYAQCVGRLLPDSMIASDTRVFTVVRRSLSAKESFVQPQVSTGVAVAGLPEQMHLVDTSDPKQAESASNHSWRKKGWRDRTEQCWSNSSISKHTICKAASNQ